MGYAAIAGHTDIIEILSQFAHSHYTIWANFVKISIFTIYCKDDTYLDIGILCLHQNIF